MKKNEIKVCAVTEDGHDAVYLFYEALTGHT